MLRLFPRSLGLLWEASYYGPLLCWTVPESILGRLRCLAFPTKFCFWQRGGTLLLLRFCQFQLILIFASVYTRAQIGAYTLAVVYSNLNINFVRLFSESENLFRFGFGFVTPSLSLCSHQVVCLCLPNPNALQLLSIESLTLALSMSRTMQPQQTRNKIQLVVALRGV
jgi:hypothetical protein